ncbi:hypothetical protein NA78x_001169 [Anatilimnocola sp. NA78]|uniref:hypothetical protein n=1 Tax=Anatilimnocola sp. NA78 TaxID=3415683 RepID=UPI003CE4943C
MQLTLRDYFWLMLVLGLSIGILIETKDLQTAQEWQAKAEYWRQAAEKAAERLRTHGDSVTFDDQQQAIDIRDQRGRTMHRSWGGTGYRSKQSESWLTGKIDLDYMLLGSVTLLPASLGLGLLFRKLFPQQGKAYAKFSIRSHRWIAPIFILQTSAMSTGAFAWRLPFYGTAAMTVAALFVVGYLSHHVELTPELEQHIDENYEKPLQLGSLFKLKK